MKNKNIVIIVAAVLLIAVVAGFFFTQQKKELTEATFPKKIEGYTLVDVKAGEETAGAQKQFLGIKEPIKKTFLSNYKAPGAIVTLWVLVPDDPAKVEIIAEQMAENMVMQKSLFSGFKTINTPDNKPLVTFIGPMDGMTHYVYFKDGKVFWASVVTKGDAQKAFEVFYKEF